VLKCECLAKAAKIHAIMKMNNAFLPAVIIVGAAFLTATRAGAQLVNGSFEKGTYSSTIGGKTNRLPVLDRESRHSPKFTHIVGHNAGA
jgi:hypothetical protein